MATEAVSGPELGPRMVALRREDTVAVLANQPQPGTGHARPRRRAFLQLVALGISASAIVSCGDTLAGRRIFGGVAPTTTSLAVASAPVPDLSPTALQRSATPAPEPTIAPSPSTSPSPPPTTPTPRPTVAPTTIRGATSTGLGALPLPIRVRVPKIKVDAAIETVGLESDGVMEKPHTPDIVAWYGFGPAPGEPGASVLAGHVDSVHGPAVFWSLQDLQPNDTIEVDLAGKATCQFVVEQLRWYAPEAAPIDEIFATTGPARLNLITCGGVFDRTRHAYDKRLIVATRLVKST